MRNTKTLEELYVHLNGIAQQLPMGHVTYSMPDAWAIYQAILLLTQKYSPFTAFEFAGGYGFSSGIVLTALQDSGMECSFTTVEQDGTRTSCLRQIVSQFSVSSTVLEQDIMNVSIPDCIHFYLQDGNHYNMAVSARIWSHVVGGAFIHDVREGDPWITERTWVLNYLKEHQWNWIDIYQTFIPDYLPRPFAHESGGSAAYSSGLGILGMREPIEPLLAKFLEVR